MSMIVRVRAGIAGIAQLHLQGNVNGGIRPANSEEQHRQMEQQFDTYSIRLLLQFCNAELPLPDFRRKLAGGYARA